MVVALLPVLGEMRVMVGSGGGNRWGAARLTRARDEEARRLQGHVSRWVSPSGMTKFVSSASVRRAVARAMAGAPPLSLNLRQLAGHLSDQAMERIWRAHWHCVLAMCGGADGLVLTIAVRHADMCQVDPVLPVRGFCDLVTTARSRSMQRIKRLTGTVPEFWISVPEPLINGMSHVHCLVFVDRLHMSDAYDIIEADLHKVMAASGGHASMLSVERSDDVTPADIKKLGRNGVLGALWYLAKALLTVRSYGLTRRPRPCASDTAAWRYLNAIPRSLARSRETDQRAAQLDRLLARLPVNSTDARWAATLLLSLAGRPP